MRVKARSEHNKVALTVIYFLGVIAFFSMMWSGYLIHEAVVSDNEIDSAAVALVGQMVSIATLGLGALGAMLSSTSPKPPPPPTVSDGSAAVTVVNPPEDPVQTQPQPPEDAPEPDPAPEDPAADPEVPEGADGPPDEDGGDPDAPAEVPFVESKRTRRSRTN